MEFKYHQFSDLPTLAWCAIVPSETSDIYIYHGNGVEAFKDFFVEGAWDGDFHCADFDETDFFAGSGGKVLRNRSGGVLFSTSNNVLEKLYSISTNGVIYLSNSLPFVLYMSGTELDPKYLKYETDFNSILKGINNYTKYIPLDGGLRVQLHYYCNILLNNNFELVEYQKNEIKSFTNYNDYEKRLLQTLKKLADNAQSPVRKIKYGLVTTISKGYDSAACAAMVYEIGCKNVVSFDKPQQYMEDCGDDIAKKLGYKSITTKGADEYLGNTVYIEAEFVSSGELGTWIIFTAFENEFKNNVVFIGERGDKLWDKNSPNPNNEFRFDNEVFTGTSMIENRLRVGYIVLPVPLFGAPQWISIHEISNSDEMKNYSIGGNYDRPIPRKILEDRGIARDSFGMKKKGAGFNYRFDNLNRIKKRMSKKSFNSFHIYYLNNKRKGINIIKAWVVYLWHTKSYYMSYFLGRIGICIKNNKLSVDAIANPGAPSYLFNWGIFKMIKRYEKADISRWWLTK